MQLKVPKKLKNFLLLQYKFIFRPLKLLWLPFTVSAKIKFLKKRTLHSTD